MLNFAVISLLITNLAPLIGVMFYGWDVSQIILLYWFENVVVGIYNVAKMLFANASYQDSKRRNPYT